MVGKVAFDTKFK